MICLKIRGKDKTNETVENVKYRIEIHIKIWNGDPSTISTKFDIQNSLDKIYRTEQKTGFVTQETEQQKISKLGHRKREGMEKNKNKNRALKLQGTVTRTTLPPTSPTREEEWVRRAII